MSCYNNGCYNPYGGYNPCGATCYRTDYNPCCNPCQQPCNQTVVKLPSTLTVTPLNSLSESNNQFEMTLAGSGLSGHWVGGTTSSGTATLNGGGGGTLCCCPCAIETSLSGEAGTVSNNNTCATPLTINITGSSASATGTLQGQVSGGSFTGTVNFPSATVTCCNGVKTVTLAAGVVTW